MAPAIKMTEYERQRMENIRRNDEMMAALKLQHRAAELTAASKRQKVETRTYKTTAAKKVKDESPVVIRRSPRIKGLEPVGGSTESPKEEMKVSPREPCSISMKDAQRDCGCNSAFIETVRKISRKKEMHSPSVKPLGGIEVYDVKPKKGLDVGISEDVKLLSNADSLKMEDDCETNFPGSSMLSRKQCKKEKLWGSVGDEKKNVMFDLKPKVEGKSMGLLDMGSLVLEEKNIARVVPGRILSVKFFPTANMRMVAVGNKFGNVGFWNMNPGENGDEGIYLYYPHTAPVSGISFPDYECSKMFTSAYDGFIRLMDVEKEMFDLVYHTEEEEAIFSLCQQPNSTTCLFFGEGQGSVKSWDERAGKSSSSWALHEARINSIDFHPQNPFIMATSSSDGSACIWDIRNISADRLKNLRVIDHEKAVHSAFFSPSGSFLASTSSDNSVGFTSGIDFQETTSVHHENHTNRWISTFKASWGWDDSHVFIGNMSRAVDVISIAEKRTMLSLVSPYMTAIPCRFAVHPYEVGVLAGATAGGQVYTWTPQ